MLTFTVKQAPLRRMLQAVTYFGEMGVALSLQSFCSRIRVVLLALLQH